MAIAVLVVTHGQAAGPLMQTAEMIIGAQQNVLTLEFVPGENREVLADKMRQGLQTLDSSDGVLFLVDLWGGTPFHAAGALSQELAQAQVVTGVNVPMLVETLMARDDSDDLAVIAAKAVECGREGVQALAAEKSPAPTTIAQTTTPAPAAAASTTVANQAVDDNDPEIMRLRAEESRAVKEGPHMSFGLWRIDDRLIHGQVATRWTKETGVNRIIVVNDQVVKDKTRSTMLKQAVPPGVSAHVVDVDKMMRVYNNPEYANEKVMLLFTNPSDALELIRRGVPIKSINIGGMAYKEGRTMLDTSVSVNAEDVAAFEELHRQGIELEIRKVASDKKVLVLDLIKEKYKPA